MIILPAKRVVDIVPLRADFSAVMQPGDSIASFEITIFVFSGVDPGPSLKVNTSDLLPPDTVVAHLEAGLPGVVYDVLVTVVTEDGFEFSQEARLALLKDAFPAGPVYQLWYLTSLPYPAYAHPGDVLRVVPSVLAGSLHTTIVITDTEDTLAVSPSVLDGVIRETLRRTTVADSLSVTPSVLDGTMVMKRKTTTAEDNILPTPSVLDGTMKTILIRYTVEDGIAVTPTVLNGSLTS